MENKMSLSKINRLICKFVNELENIAKKEDIIFQSIVFNATITEDETGEISIVYDIDAHPVEKNSLIESIKKEEV
jgi:hypothetical protein